MKIAGLVLAAGTGSRLRPITDAVPKPLLPLTGEPLLGVLIDTLIAAGAQHVFANLHHHAEMMGEYLAGQAWGAPVTFRREQVLTGPAGALALFAEELAEFDVVMVVSGDVLFTAPLNALLDTHVRQASELTFATVRTTGARRYGVLRIAPGGAVVGAREKPDVPDEEVHSISAGVYCLSPAAVAEAVRLAETQDAVDYARHLAPALLDSGHRVGAWHLPGYWKDIGTPESLRQAITDVLSGALDGAGPGADGVHIATSARLGEGVQVSGTVLIGPHARVGAGASLVNTIVLPGADVAAGSVIVGGLVAGSPGSLPPRWWIDRAITLATA